jgi:hypothetical protein
LQIITERLSLAIYKQYHLIIIKKIIINRNQKVFPKEEGRTIFCKTLHQKLKIEQHEPAKAEE